MEKSPAPTEDDVYAYFSDTFQLIYADLVAVLGDKPSQIVLQIDVAFAHLASARRFPEYREDNQRKALGHLQRAALDASKLLWLTRKKEVNGFIADEDVRRFCTNCSETEFLEKYREAESLATEARRTEVQSVGVGPDAAIDLYYRAAVLFDEALGFVDAEKYSDFRRFRLKYIIRRHAVGFVTGLLASGVVTFLAYLL